MTIFSLHPNSLPAGQADPAERLGFRCAMFSMLLSVLLSPLCFRSDTSVCSWCIGQGMLTVFRKFYGLSECLMHGHCLPGFWTRNRKVSNQWCCLSSERLSGSFGLGYLVLGSCWEGWPCCPWRISIDQISFARCANRLLSSRMLCTCYRLCKQFFWESAQLCFGLRPMSQSLVCCACCFDGRALVDPHGVFARIMARIISAYFVPVWHS